MDLTLYRYDVWVLQYQFNRLIMLHRGGMMRGLFEGFQGFRGFSSPCDNDFGPLMMQARKERERAAQACSSAGGWQACGKEWRRWCDQHRLLRTTYCVIDTGDLRVCGLEDFFCKVLATARCSLR